MTGENGERKSTGWTGCGFEESCENFAPGPDGYCVGRPDDPLECWVDKRPPTKAEHEYL